MSSDSATLMSMRCGPTTFPPKSSQRYLPLNVYFSRTLSTSDGAMYDELVKPAEIIKNAAIAEGQHISDAVLYPSYALYGTAVEKMCGDNAGTLAALKAKYDPENVMGLAGGWMF